MYDIVPCIHYLSGIGNGYVPVLFQNPVHRFPDYLNISLHCPSQTQVIAELVKYFGLSPKNDSISLIASSISCKCLFIFSSIYQLLCRINTFPEIRIFYGLFLDQVDLPPEQVLQRILEIEVIVEIVLHFVFLEINDQINVALVIKSVSQHRPEYEKPVYLVPFAQGNYVLDMIVYQFHLSVNIR